jgi:hypothetical protein
MRSLLVMTHAMAGSLAGTTPGSNASANITQPALFKNLMNVISFPDADYDDPHERT